MKSSEDKVDLSSVNKPKKSLGLPKLKNPFRKQTGPVRDEQGKFASGSGGLLAAKKLNLKRMLPVVVVVSLVGGFMVFRSFASVTPPPAYQYSVTTCKSNSLEALKKCKNESAEALVFRLYRAASNRNPDPGGYKHWTQKLAGDRMQPTDVASQFVAVKSITDKTNQKFVDDLYANLKLGGDAKGKAYWVGVLNSKSWSRGKVVAHFTTASEAITKQSADTATFLSAAPTVAVVQTARKQVEADTKYAKEQINAKTYHIVKGMQSRSKLNNDLKVAAGKISDKSQGQMTPADLSTIRTKHSAVIAGRLTNFKGKDWQGAVNDNYNKVKERYDKAAKVNKYSPDITFVGLTAELKVAQAHKNEAKRQVENAQWLLNETNRALTIAQGKYDAEQRRLEEVARRARDANNASGGGTVPGVNWRACNVPVKNITSGSTRNCIARLQHIGGITEDGIWGNNTEAVARFIRNSGNSNPCSNPDSQACRDALAAELGNMNTSNSGSTGTASCSSYQGYFKSEGYCWSNASSKPTCPLTATQSHLNSTWNKCTWGASTKYTTCAATSSYHGTKRLNATEGKYKCRDRKNPK